MNRIFLGVTQCSSLIIFAHLILIEAMHSLYWLAKGRILNPYQSIQLTVRPKMTNEEHNKYLAWAFIGHGSFQLFMTLLIIAIFGLALGLPDQPGETPPPVEFLLVIFGFIFVFQMLFVIPSYVAAFALLKRKSWARIASIVAGMVAAMNVPFGTLACVYSLWFFLGDNWKQIYGDKWEGTATGMPQLAAEREMRWTGYRTDERGEIVFHKVEPPDWR